MLKLEVIDIRTSLIIFNDVHPFRALPRLYINFLSEYVGEGEILGFV